MRNYYGAENKVLVAVDCIIFGFDQQEEELKLLLVKRDIPPEMGKWSLMGGFMLHDETLDDAAIRVLYDLTGLRNIYMEQLRVFSKVDRDPVARTLSVAYFALINIEDHDKHLIQNYGAKWFSINRKPVLIFDHNQMVEGAIRRLRRRAATNPIGFELLPEKFTMRQLQKLYEAIYSEELDKRNFNKKINSLDVLEKLDEKDKTSSRKGSFLYRFNQEKYLRKMDDGFVFKMK